MWQDIEALRARLRAANPVPPSFDHLRDPEALLRRLSITDVGVGDDDSVEDAESVRRTRKPTVASVIRQMRRAGVEVAGCEINPRDGTVRVISGKPSEATTPDSHDDDRNEWDTVQ